MEKRNSETKEQPEIVKIAKEVTLLYERGNIRDAVDNAITVFGIIKRNPTILNEIDNLKDIGQSVCYMLNHKVAKEIDVKFAMTNIAYFCLSKSIKMNKNDIDLYKDRILLMILGNDVFKYTISTAYKETESNIYSKVSKFKDIIKNSFEVLDYSDLVQNPILCNYDSLFMQRLIEIENFISKNTYKPYKTKNEIVSIANEIHLTIMEYLENKIIIENDLFSL